MQAEAGSKIQLGRVLALKHDGKFHVGKPYLEGIAVEAEILEDLKGPKVIVYKMKPKKHLPPHQWSPPAAYQVYGYENQPVERMKGLGAIIIIIRVIRMLYFP